MFLVDSAAGLQAGDEDVLNVLRKNEKPFTVVANKCDGKELEAMSAEFYQMGVDQVLSCSALHGRGVKDVVEEILRKLPFYEALVNAAQEQSFKEQQVQAELEQEFKQGFAELEQAQDWFEEDGEDRHDRLTEKSVV